MIGEKHRMHPNSIANLKPAWKEGDPSPNPGGKPKGCSLVAPILRKLAENPNEFGEGAEAVEIANITLERAKRGEPIGDILKLFDRTDGSLKTQIEHSTAPPPPPLQVEGTQEQVDAIRRLANGT